MDKNYNYQQTAIKLPDSIKKFIEKMREKNMQITTPLTDESVLDSYEDGELIENDEEYKYNISTRDISFIELAIINSYLHSCYLKKHDGINVIHYGDTDSIGRVNFKGNFGVTGQYWFMCKMENLFKDDDIIIQTKCFIDNGGYLLAKVNFSSKIGLTSDGYEKLYKDLMSLAFNNSEYNGKCLKIKLKDGRFQGIEIINIEKIPYEIVLNPIQKKYMEHFKDRVRRGSVVRYLLNGEPGTGKTESIRDVIRDLIPATTFIIPEFSNNDDLTTILEACEIFKNPVMIMDDIDLYLGSRENGTYTRVLGQFLSFFDGVKKRKISLIGSTNDKGLVDKAAERPGRFNLTIDFGFLTDEQIVEVCKIHLPEKWHLEEVYETLKGKIGGVKANITGAFISNLSENLKEMSEDNPEWVLEDTLSLITETYRGFYSSQVEKAKSGLTFKV
jgi:hypothetical protein